MSNKRTWATGAAIGLLVVHILHAPPAVPPPPGASRSVTDVAEPKSEDPAAIIPTTTDSTTTSASSLLADGCYHIFLDVGANLGVHGRFLLEANKYPQASIAQAMFDREFGITRDNRDFCVFAFEPNPSHHAKIRKTQDAYHAMGWRYTLIPKGVSDADSILTFYHQGDKRNEEWGFSTRPLGKINNDTKVDIPVLRLADFLNQQVYPRSLPDRIYGDYSNITNKEGVVGGPKILMKIDIETMEYRVLPDLLYSGVLCKMIDYVFGEFHKQNKFYPLTLDESHKIYHAKHGLSYIRTFISAMEVNPNCQTRFKEEDEEAYLHDGVPLPEPPRTT